MLRCVLPLLLLSTTLLHAQEVKPYNPAELRKQPIATGNSPVAKLLQKWWEEGTAAGNVGDFYDNRDGEHSPLNLSPWPQLQKIHYTPEQVKQRLHWAAQSRLLPHVVFGNSSTSAPPRTGGSNPRHYYVSPRGLALLYQHYTKNNLYIYPEHRDHDPGRNGRGPSNEEGYGDLYPTNTPYLLISQGSSGSDQPFMRALPYVLAAFRPEVKKKLVENGLLMPTIQMIFRATNNHLKEASEYLTGKAHPTVFEGAWVNPLKMVQLAHEITSETIPPLVQLKVMEEEQPKPGIDFFELAKDEKLCDTPCVIARIFRGKEKWRKIIISAADSQDLNRLPLKYEFRLLRGDPERVKIKPRNDSGSEVEIQVAHPERRPIAPGSKMESPRVDIGVFVSNGKHWSAPGFITFFGLDHESRTYDENGRMVEIGYGSGETRLVVSDWGKLLELAGKEGVANKVCGFTASAKKTLLNMRQEWQQLQTEVDQLRAAVKGEPAKAKHLQEAEKRLRDFPQRQQPELGNSLAGVFEGKFRTWLTAVDRPVDELTSQEIQAAEASATPAQQASLKKLRERLRCWGHFSSPHEKSPNGPQRKEPTRFDRELSQQLVADSHAALLFPGALRAERQINLVDFRLSLPREWRDVYQYDPKGVLIGWTRYQPDLKEPAHFTADGHLIEERDAQGRCQKARVVRYAVAGQPKSLQSLRLHWTATETVVSYQYASAEDQRGKVKEQVRE